MGDKYRASEQPPAAQDRDLFVTPRNDVQDNLQSYRNEAPCRTGDRHNQSVTLRNGDRDIDIRDSTVIININGCDRYQSYGQDRRYDDYSLNFRQGACYDYSMNQQMYDRMNYRNQVQWEMQNSRFMPPINDCYGRCGGGRQAWGGDAYYRTPPFVGPGQSGWEIAGPRGRVSAVNDYYNPGYRDFQDTGLGRAIGAITGTVGSILPIFAGVQMARNIGRGGNYGGWNNYYPNYNYGPSYAMNYNNYRYNSYPYYV